MEFRADYFGSIISLSIDPLDPKEKEVSFIFNMIGSFGRVLSQSINRNGNNICDEICIVADNFTNQVNKNYLKNYCIWIDDILFITPTNFSEVINNINMPGQNDRFIEKLTDVYNRLTLNNVLEPVQLIILVCIFEVIKNNSPKTILHNY